jgi:hypothetical protein
VRGSCCGHNEPLMQANYGRPSVRTPFACRAHKSTMALMPVGAKTLSPTDNAGVRRVSPHQRYRQVGHIEQHHAAWCFMLPIRKASKPDDALRPPATEISQNSHRRCELVADSWPHLSSDHVRRIVRSASRPVVAMKSSSISTTAVGDSTCGKCPTPASTSSRLSGTAS